MRYRHYFLILTIVILVIFGYYYILRTTYSFEEYRNTLSEFQLSCTQVENIVVKGISIEKSMTCMKDKKVTIFKFRNSEDLKRYLKDVLKFGNCTERRNFRTVWYKCGEKSYWVDKDKVGVSEYSEKWTDNLLTSLAKKKWLRNMKHLCYISFIALFIIFIAVEQIGGENGKEKKEEGVPKLRK